MFYLIKPKKANQPKLNNRLKTLLEFSEHWDMDQQERYIFQYYHNKLKGLDPNQINIHGVQIHKTGEGFIMTAIIRHSLEKHLNLQDIRLVVSDSEGKELARKDFNMEYFGVLNTLRARPWMFEFEAETFLVPEEEIQSKMEFEVLFDIPEPTVSEFSLQLDENWSNGLTEEQTASLETTLASMEPTKQNEISVSAFNLSEDENGVNVFVLIRNAFEEETTISNLPLQLFDANNELVAQLGFPLEQFTIKPVHARPISLHFPKAVFTKENPDWTNWNIQLTAQN